MVDMIIKKLLVACLSALFLVVQSSCNNREGVTVVMETTEGVIELMLYDETPGHRDNFVSLIEDCYFDSLLFHRVIENFMIQGGDPDSKHAPQGVRLGEGGPDYRLNAEIRTPQLFHKRGALAAAREPDDVNPAKMSAASQFYIVWGRVYTSDELTQLQRRMEEYTGRPFNMSGEQITAYMRDGGTPFLDGEYTVFGEVVSGLDVVERIQRVACDSFARPLSDVRILKMRIKNNY